jgi:hypothetical protein
MGFGLKALESIPKDNIIIKMNTNMGFVSNQIIDEEIQE